MDITDKERLDWLQDNKQCLFRVIKVNKKYRTDGTNDVDITEEFLGWSVESRMDECSTVREAIDAGIDAEKKNAP